MSGAGEPGSAPALAGCREPLVLFGCGNMGGAMLAGWLAAGYPPEQVTVVDPRAGALPPGVARAEAVSEPAAIVCLAFKPQQLAEAAPMASPAIGPDTLCLSILAGVEHDVLAAHFGAARSIVRVMPNMAVGIGASPVAVHAQALAAEDRALVDRLLGALGSVEWLESEEQMHLVTALAGSGPAFVFRFIEALAGGASALGLPADQSERLALAMVEGAARLALASDATPGELARRVASPGGVTQLGLDVLDEDAALGRLVRATLRAARDRSREMAEASRAG